MAGGRVTLYVESLPAWVLAAPDVRVPTLESLVARGRPLAILPDLPDAARLALFGIDCEEADVPAGALTAAAVRQAPATGYWLRADPVTLNASMTQVFLAGSGLCEYTDKERAALAEAVAGEFERSGLELESGHRDYWALRLAEPVDVAFTPLHRVLGADVADHMPSGPQSRPWRRLMTEVQVLLHNHPVNEARRHSGQAVVNGIWFWGGGTAPRRPDALALQRVFSDHPVSAGLAWSFGAEVRTAGSAPDDAAQSPVQEIVQASSSADILVDWPWGRAEAAEELRRLDTFMTQLVDVADVRLYAGPRGWRSPRGRWQGWWKSRRRLADALGPGADA